MCELLIHRGFIAVGYDGGNDVRDEERLVVADTEHPPPDDQQNLRKSSVDPTWGFITALVIFAGVVIVIIYGYLARPGWIGVADKKFWDYLELLIVPAALAIGVYLLNRERARSLLRELVPDWQPTREQKLWASRSIIVLVVLLGVLTLIGQIFEITVADWLSILAVPIAVGAAVPLLNWLQKKRELDVEHQRAQDEALQAYLDQMGQLLLDKDRPLRKSKEGDEIRMLARARTLTVLELLDASRKTRVMRFLVESVLIQKEEGANEGHVTSQPVITLSGANLRGFDLIRANLRGATLSWANLSGAYLRRAYLKDANLRGVTLSEAYLIRANLSGANLKDANLSQVDLSEADLSDTIGFTEEQLEEQARTLEGATMPNGHTYEDLLKDKEGHGTMGRTAALRNGSERTSEKAD